MSKRDPTKEFWRAAKEERVRQAREKTQHREPPPGAGLDHIVANVQATDEATRAQAVRDLCPCRIGWDGFQREMDVVARMAKDRSPEVRRQALHVFQDAFEMQCSESRKADREPPESSDSDSLKRARKRGRQMKQEMTAAFRRPHRPR
jgi:hypothetical protein